MNKQEIFDFVATHLFTQGKAAVGPNGICRYRYAQRDGAVLTCAVGCLISDEEYDSNMDNDMDNTGIRSIVKRFPQLSRFEPNVSLLAYLQSIHDENTYWAETSSMQEPLRRCANMFGLDATVLDGLKFKDR